MSGEIYGGRKSKKYTQELLVLKKKKKKWYWHINLTRNKEVLLNF